MLSNEESSKLTTQEVTYEQLVEQYDKGRRGEPTLVTTLAPYNYEIDLPFKQPSSTQNARMIRA